MVLENYTPKWPKCSIDIIVSEDLKIPMDDFKSELSRDRVILRSWERSS